MKVCLGKISASTLYCRQMGLSCSCFAVYTRAAFCPVCSHGFKVYRQAGKTVGRISGVVHSALVVHSAHNRENALASGDCHRLGNTLGTPVIHGDRNPLSIHLRHPPPGKPTVFLCRMRARQELPKHLAALSALGWESTWKLRL